MIAAIGLSTSICHAAPSGEPLAVSPSTMPPVGELRGETRRLRVEIYEYETMPNLAVKLGQPDVALFKLFGVVHEGCPNESAIEVADPAVIRTQDSVALAGSAASGQEVSKTALEF